MTRKTTRAHLVRAVEPLLHPGESFVAGCAAWMADQRPKIPLVFTGRAIYLIAITSERLLVFDTPRRGRPVLEADLLLQRRHDALELVRVRGWLPLLQLRIAPAPDRIVVLEFRPRDRRVGRNLIRLLGRRSGGEPERGDGGSDNGGSDNGGSGDGGSETDGSRDDGTDSVAATA